MGWGESNLSVLFLWWFLFTYDFSSFFCIFNQYYLIFFCSLLYLFVNSYLICNQLVDWNQLVGADSVHLFPTLHPEWSHIASLKSGMVRIFMPWKLANAISQRFVFLLRVGLPIGIPLFLIDFVSWVLNSSVTGIYVYKSYYSTCIEGFTAASASLSRCVIILASSFNAICLVWEFQDHDVGCVNSNPSHMGNRGSWLYTFRRLFLFSI